MIGLCNFKILHKIYIFQNFSGWLESQTFYNLPCNNILTKSKLHSTLICKFRLPTHHTFKVKIKFNTAINYIFGAFLQN